MSIYLTLDNLNDLISSKSLKILKKNQKENGTNYYFTPNLVLKLYGAKVIFINPKFLVFQFCKIKNSSLYLLLKSINSILLNELKKTHSEMFNKEIYSFFLMSMINLPLDVTFLIIKINILLDVKVVIIV